MQLKILKSYRSKSFKTLSKYASSSLFRSVVAMISGVLILRWVPPQEIGIWSAVLLIQPYLQFINLGIHIGVNRELPYSLGKKDLDKSRRIINTGYFFSIISAFIGFAVMTIYSIYIVLYKDIAFLAPAIIVIVIVFITFLQLFLTSLYRTNNDFSKLSNIYLVESLSMIVTIPLVYKWGFNGFLIYQLVYRVALFLLTLKYKPFQIKAEFYKTEFKELISIGFPLFIFGYINGIIKTIPRLYILSFSSIYNLGLYSPINTISNSLHLASRYIAQFFSPKMAFKLGEDENSKAVFWSYSLKSTISVFVLNIIIFIPLYFLIELLIPIALPKYVESITAMQIILLSGLMSGAAVGITALNAIKDLKGRLFLTILNSLAIISFILIYTNLIDDILIAMALSVISGDFLYYIISLFYVRFKFIR